MTPDLTVWLGTLSMGAAVAFMGYAGSEFFRSVLDAVERNIAKSFVGCGPRTATCAAIWSAG